MSDLAGQTDPAAENAAPVETAPTGDTGSGDNPAWAPLRDALDPISYSKVTPYLKEFDKQANTRIESLNQEYGWAKELTKQGITPDHVTMALGAAQALSERPEEVYSSLQTFLQENNRLPNQQELAQQVEDDKEDDKTPSDPRLDQIAQQQQQLADAFEAQQQSQQQAIMAQQAEQSLGQEIADLKTKHPDFQDADVQEVIRRAAATAQVNLANGRQEVPSLEDMAAEWIGQINRIRSTPRPGDSAPRLLPTNGGVPSSGAVSQKTLGQLPRQDIQNLIADSLEASRTRSA